MNAALLTLKKAILNNKLKYETKFSKYPAVSYPSCNLYTKSETIYDFFSRINSQAIILFTFAFIKKSPWIQFMQL